MNSTSHALSVKASCRAGRCLNSIHFAAISILKTFRFARLAAALLILLLAASVRAGSFVGFETVGPNAATDGLVLARQFRPTMGIRFSRADGGSVTLAKAGAPATAFAAGQDTATYAAGDSLPATDPWAVSVGDFFVKLSGTPATALVIDYDYPAAAAAGLILDVDADETWVIRAYSDSGSTLVAEAVLAGGSPRARATRSSRPGPSCGRWQISSSFASCRPAPM